MGNWDDIKILVADDNVASLEKTVHVLKKSGYQVFSAKNGAGCFELLNKEKPDIVLLDIILPDMKGKDICRKIKSDPENSSVFIILLSALRTRSESILEGLEEGADGYIKRPVEDRELLARIKAACRTVAAETKIRDSALLLEACIDSPKDMIVLAVDKQYNYLAFNTYHKKVMLQAYGKDIRIGMNLLDCITNTEDKVSSKINYDKALAGEGHLTIAEYGELDRQCYETRYNPIYNSREEIIGATAFSVNVTERRKMEVALKESERLLRESQSIARLGSFVWDISTGFWKSSEILDEIFGIDPGYIRSFEGWADIIHPEWKDIMTAYVINEVLGKHMKFDKEYQIIRKNDNEVRWVHGLADIELDTNNQPVILIGTISDITDQKQIENLLEAKVRERTARLEAANHELESFAHSVSHDLRAPLRAIDGFSKFVLEDYGKQLEPEGHRLLELIRSNTEKMDQLITDILALSRVTRSEHRESKIDMARMAISMYNESISQDIREGLSFIIAPMPETVGDPTFLKQVWTNLISNAVKFSSRRSKPEIKLGGYTENGFNIFYVKDNGAGFNPDYSHKLFNVFQRLHKPGEFEGTGVGLATVKRIITRHGGQVWAEGKEGEGATFFFSIPVKEY